MLWTVEYFALAMALAASTAVPLSRRYVRLNRYEEYVAINRVGNPISASGWTMLAGAAILVMVAEIPGRYYSTDDNVLAAIAGIHMTWSAIWMYYQSRKGEVVLKLVTRTDVWTGEEKCDESLIRGRVHELLVGWTRCSVGFSVLGVGLLVYSGAV